MHQQEQNRSRVKNATTTRILEIQEKMDCWTSFVRELDVPSDLSMIFATGRMELFKLVKPKALNADEVKILYDLIAGLLETNMALREHAQLVAEMSSQQLGNLNGLSRSLFRIKEFANFRSPIEEEDDD